MNAPLPKWNPEYGYRFANLPPSVAGSSDSLFIVASFSGGGARASALSYGVLKELSQTPIVWEGYRKTLADELNIINAVSGGSFTAAYYALHHHRIFEDFESRFLRKDWEGELRARILRSPLNWLRLLSPYFGRSHIFAELLDEALFEGATFNNLLSSEQRPLIYLHASDMATVSRFEFNQRQFDLICSDLSKLRLSVATASSAALPLILSPISLKNYGGQCGLDPPAYLTESKRTSWFSRRRVTELRSYIDSKERPYIHLLDGGLADNIGMRYILEFAALVDDLDSTFQTLGVRRVQKLVFLVVSAETDPDLRDFKLNELPSLTRVLNALVDIPINRYSDDTVALMQQAVLQWRAQLLKRARSGDTVFTPDADIYLINASLSEVEDSEERARLMSIPTNLSLTDAQVDDLLQAASKLIKNDKEFQRLLRDLGAGAGKP
jgi:NTE family protein